MSAQAITNEAMLDYLSVLVPPEKIHTADWVRQWFRAHDGQNARAFSEHEVPWVTAPNGPCDAIDNPKIRYIWLQWAARCFKTTFAQSVMLMHADIDPCSMMFATADQKLCESIFDRFWKIIDACEPVSHEAPAHPRDRSNTHIRLRRSEVFGAWSRGVATLADKAIKIAHANEIDKWATVSTSKEGNPLTRLFKRTDQFPDAKIIIESTPSKSGSSPVERGYLRSTACSYWVPCPHCQKFQPLEFGTRESVNGIKWEKGQNGHSDPELAYQTAVYVCRHCQQGITDINRPWMMNAGVHVPEGCQVDHDKAMDARKSDDRSYPWLIGEAKHQGQHYGSHISVMYALFAGWGQIAQDFLLRRDKTTEYRQWLNEDMAETWTERVIESDWEDFSEKASTEVPRLIVPEDFSMLTIGIDKQADGTLPYTVDAWDPRFRNHTVDFGYATDTDELFKVLDRAYEHADGGPPLKIACGLIDSGYKPKDVNTFVKLCRDNRINMMMCKGSGSDLKTMFKRSKLPKGSANPGAILINVDSKETQNWIDDSIHMRIPGVDDESLTVFKLDPFGMEPFCKQLFNDEPIETIDPTGNSKIVWERRDRSIPNDWRDCKRYSRVALAVITRNGTVPPRDVAVANKDKQRKQRQAARKPKVSMPDGRPFYLGDR